MLTPQQLDEITLDTAVFGGYDTKSVDAFLEPLIEDYVALYKENDLLKSRMRVLVEKLEEYRAKEASLRDAMDNAQKTCDQMILEAEAKCKQMMDGAKSNPVSNAGQDAEKRRKTTEQIAEIQQQMQTWIVALEQIKPDQAEAMPAQRSTDELAAEIDASLKDIIGGADDPVAMTNQNKNRSNRRHNR